MKTWLHRAVTAVTIATLIVALATFGGYRLAGSHSSVPRPVRLAAGTFSYTYLSGTGKDSNSATGCQRTTPCLDLGVALGQTLSGGEVDVLDPCACGGTNITQAVTVDGLGGGKASFNTAGDGIIVEGGPSAVIILRHLQLQGKGANGDGIKFVSGKELILDDVTVEGFPFDGVDVALSAGGSTLSIINSRIYNNVGDGVFINPTSSTVHVNISHSSIENNNIGVYSGDGDVLDLSDTVISGNTQIGLIAQTYHALPSLVHATRDQFDNNPYAILENHGAGNAQIIVWLSDNDVVNNTNAIAGNTGGTLAVFSFGNNRLANNVANGAPNGTAMQT